jgi:PKD repeat protein
MPFTEKYRLEIRTTQHNFMRKISNSIGFTLTLHPMKKFLFTITCFFKLSLSFSQHHCGTDHFHHHISSKHQDIKRLENEYNKHAVEYVKNRSVDIQKRAAKYTVPVVFHVIHTGGNENISREQIQDQIRILNEDFSYTNANKVNLRNPFKNAAGIGDIEFQLASVDPNGNCFDGVNRIYSTAGINMDMSKEPVKDLAYWNKSKYLNIWVVTDITGSGSTGTVLGYAVFPWMQNFSKDGIVIRHDRVGSIGTASGTDDGRTLTHEIGHWLGLYHTFQDGCSDGDLCDDTPPVASTFTNANCPQNGNSCSNDFPDLPDMWENYMDYSNGKCMSVFTKQQVSRMHYFLTSLRTTIYSNSNLVSVGVLKQNVKPTAMFNANTRTICAGKPVTFYDLSCKGAVTGRLWTFTGAQIQTSTDENPSVMYSKPGTYEVKLQVQNNFGSDTRTETAYITVLKEFGEADPNFEEGFESGDPMTVSGFKHLSTTHKFELTNSAAYTGSQCYKATIRSTTPNGAVFSFQTPSFNISKVASGFSPKFTFWVSYAQVNADKSETLKLYISTDCGGSWDQIYQRDGSSLAYLSAPYLSNFTPTTSNQWRRHGIGSLGGIGYGDAKNAIFRIDVISNSGNSVYIDNINMSPFFAGTQTLNAQSLQMDLFPNPSAGKSTLKIQNSSKPSQAYIALYDVTGRMVSLIYKGLLDIGEQELEVLQPQGAPHGMYFLKVETDHGSASQTIIFENE